MKKTYEKPGIVFESFSVSTHIAAGCETLTSLHSQGQCGYYVQAIEGIVFVSEATGCEWKYPEGEYGGTNNRICYHVPNDDYNLFASL